jgi:hypothetical protein
MTSAGVTARPEQAVSGTVSSTLAPAGIERDETIGSQTAALRAHAQTLRLELPE